MHENSVSLRYINESTTRSIYPQASVLEARLPNPLRVVQFFLWADVIYINSYFWTLRFIYSILATILGGKRVILHIHSLNPSAFKLAKYFYPPITRFVDKVIVSNEQIQFDLRSIKRGKSAEVEVVPAFVRAPKGMPSRPSLLPENKIIFLSACWRLSRKGGKDIYGFDLIIEALREVTSPDIFVVLIISEISDKAYYGNLLRLISRNNLSDRVLFLSKRIELVDYLPWVNCYVRATRSDGDSLSIRESLSLGIPVLASNCVKRPSGVVLFESGNSEDLARKFELFTGSLGKTVWWQHSELGQDDFFDRFRSILL